MITIFGLSYAVTNLGLSRNLVLGAIALGALGELITIPLFGHLSDRMGRRSIYLLGCIAAILLSFPGIGTRDPAIVILSFVIGMSVGHGIVYGVHASFLSEMFPSNLRYSGASLGYQIAAPIGGGLVPLAAAAMVGTNQGATWPVSVLMIVIAAITFLAGARGRRHQGSQSPSRPYWRRRSSARTASAFAWPGTRSRRSPAARHPQFSVARRAATLPSRPPAGASSILRLLKPVVGVRSVLWT